MKVDVQIIECAKGWQAELSFGIWTAYTNPTLAKTACEMEANKLRDILNAAPKSKQGGSP